jgi:hypothetical protein
MLDRFRIPWSLAFCVLAAIALFFLWEEHRAHILGLLPYALLLLCPLMHFLMHRGHGRHGSVHGAGKNGGQS